MLTVYKYKLTTGRETRLQMPQGAKITRVDNQHDELCIWAIVNTDAPLETRIIEVYGTGHSIPDGDLRFINTFMVREGTFVFHAFERILP